MRFYLGTDRLRWLWDDVTDLPLFVSMRTLEKIKNLRPATAPWALDSGGFTELDKMHEWTLSPQRYAARISRYISEIGQMEWAAPQDWMCEPHMLAKTGKTVLEHQRLTVDNLLDLRTIGPDLPIVPVLQGWEPDDYLRHVDMYSAAGFDLEAEPLVGLGSVCRRQATAEAEQIVHSLLPLRLHGFGMKTQAIRAVGGVLTSGDSMAWSYGGRRKPDPTCTKKSCNHCLHFAVAWRDQILNGLNRPSLWSAITLDDPYTGGP